MANPLAPEWLEEPADLNGLDDRVWPTNFVRLPTGECSIGGVSVRELAANFSTPLFVIDEDDFRQRATSVKNALERAAESIGTTAKVYYASKAFLSVEIASWINELELNLDVSSGGELAAALASEISPQRIGLHGNNKSTREIARAIAAGVGAIVIDSEIEIERVAAAAAAQDKVQPVRLRVNTGVHANTHDFLATAREDQKFGISISDAPALVAKIRSHRHLSFLGLHSHIGSQIHSREGFVEAVRRLVKLHAELSAVEDVAELNLGGGFGVNYRPSDEALSIHEFAEALTSAVKAECERNSIAVPKLAFEPGRVIAANPGITLYTVGTIKDVNVSEAGAIRKYVSIDGGMSDNMRPALYEAEYHAVLASRSSRASAELARVVGKHCESGDIVVRHDYLPADIGPSDLLAVAATGAYCYSLSNNYNFLTRPAVVAVRNSEARLIIRAETEADLFTRDLRYQAMKKE
ncbi:MAG: hypothetical protein RIR24_327 [Actinomycetota bacterium]